MTNQLSRYLDILQYLRPQQMLRIESASEYLIVKDDVFFVLPLDLSLRRY